MLKIRLDYRYKFTKLFYHKSLLCCDLELKSCPLQKPCLTPIQQCKSIFQCHILLTSCRTHWFQICSTAMFIIKFFVEQFSQYSHSFKRAYILLNVFMFKLINYIICNCKHYKSCNHSIFGYANLSTSHFRYICRGFYN